MISSCRRPSFRIYGVDGLGIPTDHRSIKPVVYILKEMVQMARRLLVVHRCPLCGEEVEQVPDGILKKTPHYHNTEMVVTRTGLKQYIHTSCWNSMIEENRPYNGALYL